MSTRSLRSIFDVSFLALVVDTLNTQCVDGKSITRANLCGELGLTEPLPEAETDSESAKALGITVEQFKDLKSHNLMVEAVVGSLVSLDIIQGFEARKGPGGGLGKVGEKRAPGTKDPNKKSAKNVDFPEGFLDLLTSTVDGLCTGTEPGTAKVGAKGSEMTLHTIGCSVPRRDIAKAMHKADESISSGSDTEALISAALAGGHLSGFTSKRGVGGGIIRLAPGETPAPLPADTQAEEPAEAAASDEPAAAVTEPAESTEPLDLVAELESSEETPSTVLAPGEVLDVELASAEPSEAEAQAEAPKPKRNRKGGSKKGSKA